MRLRKAGTPGSCVQNAAPPSPPQSPLALPCKLESLQGSQPPPTTPPSPAALVPPPPFRLPFPRGGHSTSPRPRPQPSPASPQVPAAEKAPLPCGWGAPAGPGARRSFPAGRAGRRGLEDRHLPCSHRGPEGRGFPRWESCPFKEAALPGCARSPWLPRCRRRAPQGGREAAASPRQTEGAAGTRHPFEPVREPNCS